MSERGHMLFKRRVCARLACALLFLTTLPGSAVAEDVRDTPINQAAERHLPDSGAVMQWAHDPATLVADGGDRLEYLEVDALEPETVKLTGLVPPIRFGSGVAEIPASTIEELRTVLADMQGRHNVRLNFVGHADNQPLSPELQAQYGDNAGLSRERAGEVAEYFQAALGLPADTVSYEWAGDAAPVASNRTETGRSQNRRVEVEVWYDELVDRVALEEVVVLDEFEPLKVCRIETVCKLRYVEGHERRARVLNLVPPLHYKEESIDVTADFTMQVRRTLANLSDKQNVVVRFVGFTDNAPLTGRTERVYGNHDVLSKARARRVALAIQDELGLQTASIESDGRGAARPLASNDTADGRLLNRRVEVEFWYDDPLQELPDEPQLCPAEAGSEMVTRVYDPPWGAIEALQLDGGQPIVPAGYTNVLDRALADVADKTRPRLRFVGYTRNERLDRRTATVYGDDIGLSAARARRTMETVAAQLQLAAEQAEFEGRGYLHSNDVVNAGFIQGDTSYVAVQVVYDELAVLDDNDGLDITPMVRELEPKSPFALNLMRITVDGEPIDDPARSSLDVQRCTDVALEAADIRFGFDNLTSSPRLSVSSDDAMLPVHGDSYGGFTGDPVRFRMYANYEYFIDRAEIRIFERDESPQATPLHIVDVGRDNVAEWKPTSDKQIKTVRELKYVLRAYGDDGNFDETAAQPLYLVNNTEMSPLEANLMEYFAVLDEAGATAAGAAELSSAVPGTTGKQLLAGYGANSLAMHNIRLSSGTVRVQGSDVPEGHTVYVAGREVPVDEDGNFVSEEILPEGAHTVEVALLDQRGNGESYLRDLAFEPSDWFYVGMADLTLSHHSSSGSMDELKGNNAPYELDSGADGRLAFFVNGKFGNKWRLTASADTREEPLDELFTNFMDKSPEDLFRRMDPDYHYPTFGDDSTVDETAPTNGKFYVKLGQRKNYGMWGNFDIGYMDNELAQVDRGLYGANVHYETPATTSFGEQRFAIDGFAAEPGTIPSRQEFRGTGGSLYFTRHQDLMIGSERLRIEIRDRSSGLVTGVANLSPVIDYDIDYLQGTILLAEPLASTVDDNLLVRTGALSGDEAYLVVRYEYTPGFDDIDALSTGAQAHLWLNDYMKVGLTANTNEEGDNDSKLYGAELTLRKSADSWFKLQGSMSEGLVSGTLVSDDGGFDFAGYEQVSFVDASANGYRADLSIGLEDISSRLSGRFNVYAQELEAGFSAPGLATPTDTQNYGGAFAVPLGDRLAVSGKADRRDEEEGIRIDAQEIDLSYQLTRRWDLSAGVRRDELTDDSPVVALTQDEGQRTDAVLQVGYDSEGSWSAYGFYQDTLSRDGDREENQRVGMGSSVRISDNMTLDSELSTGGLGSGGRIGANYTPTERTSLYLNYTLENESSAPVTSASRGNEGSLISGVKTRLSDSTSVFLESRYQHGNMATGLTYATGVNFAASEQWSIGANTDIGTLRDVVNGTETDRRAGGIRIGFGSENLQFSSGVEYRNDDNEQIDLLTTSRTTWLFKNNFKYQLTPSARLLGKLNHSDSDSSLGDFFAGGYTEGVLGYAYRPVHHDRLNALVKYTYFYNLPTTGQVTLKDVASDYVQKSHIASIDLDYDLTQRWSIGGKYAYRLGKFSYERDNPDYFDNTASLYILRADYTFLENWEILMETRLLDMPDLDEQRRGALFALSRNVGDHFKVGLGYNFTDFSSDLTDLSFDHQGTFINFTGAF